MSPVMPAARTASFVSSLLLVLLPLGPLSAQGAAARLTVSLGADAAARILHRVAAARDRGLPADALEQRALELAAKGISPIAIELQVSADEAAFLAARRALADGRQAEPRSAEIEAAASAMRRGVSAGAVSALAAAAAPERPLAVPLFVISSLLDRGSTVEGAVTAIAARVAAGAPDSALVALTSNGVGPVPPPAPVRGTVQTSRPQPRPTPAIGPPRTLGSPERQHP